MFLFDVPSVKYSDPWNSSFSERISSLVRGTMRVGYYYEVPDNSTFRYRVYNMIQVLRGRDNGISAAYFYQGDLVRMDAIVNNIDILIICRTRYDQNINKLISKTRSQRKPIFFDVDDLVFDTNYIHLILNTLDQDLLHPNVWNTWFAYVSRMGATLNLCDAAITTNDFLAERIHEFAKIPVSVIPNFMNREQLAISDEILEKKRAVNYARDEYIHIGYFSGTPTHNKDFLLVTFALERLMKENPRVVLTVVGYMNIDERLKRFGSRVEVLPFQDFINLQRVIGRVEINIIPLQANIFTHCKSELKYFEAAAVGTISVASPSFTLESAIHDGVTGYVAKSYEWSSKLQQLIGEIDRQQLDEMIENGAADARKHYAWSEQHDVILRALNLTSRC